jgi:hypothetical protein
LWSTAVLCYCFRLTLTQLSFSSSRFLIDYECWIKLNIKCTTMMFRFVFSSCF